MVGDIVGCIASAPNLRAESNRDDLKNKRHHHHLESEVGSWKLEVGSWKLEVGSC